MTLEKLVVIGSSYGGWQSCAYLVPKLKFDKSAVMIFPHINNDKIYTSLREAGVDVLGMEDGMMLEPGKAYVLDHTSDGMNPAIISFDQSPAIRLLDPDATKYDTYPIDDNFEQAAHAYRKQCIGVILSGYGCDGAKGAEQIKKFGGQILVQFEKILNPKYIYGPKGNIGREQYVRNMPRSAARATKVDFRGTLRKLKDHLNKALNK